MKRISQNREAILCSIFLSLLIAVFANAPQIDLYNTRGADWNGSYAIFDFDEPFYAAYLQSIVEGKPRRNSPYTGAADSFETPQKESYLSIQFMATYPTAFVARLFGLSLPTVMIMLTTIIAFLSTFIIFWLFKLFFDDEKTACAATLLTLFGGNLAAGQGGFYGFFTNDFHYYHTLIFLRRLLPATGFPALILFFILVWKFIAAEIKNDKLFWGILSALCFSYLVFSYFFFWTTAMAWICGLGISWIILNHQNFLENRKSVIILGIGFLIPMIPYLLFLQNRHTDVDLALALTITRQPDLWRIPEILSYIAIAAYIISHLRGWIDLRRIDFIFAFSLALTAPIVFNQQILTGHTLQSFHYQFTCVNNTSTISLIFIVFTLLRRFITFNRIRLAEIVLVSNILVIGIFDMIMGVTAFREINIRRDKILPAAQKIREITSENKSDPNSAVLSFDFHQKFWADAIDIPSLTSHPVVWKLHMSMFPDMDKKIYIERLHQYLYLQNISPQQLKGQLGFNVFMTYGFFGAETTSDIFTGELVKIKPEDKEKVLTNYEEFQRSFDYEAAKKLNLEFVLYNKKTEHDLSAIKKWFDVDEGEEIGEYVLHRVRLKSQ